MDSKVVCISTMTSNDELGPRVTVFVHTEDGNHQAFWRSSTLKTVEDWCQYLSKIHEMELALLKGGVQC